MKKILVDHGERSVLEKLFRCSAPTVRSALAGRSQSALSKRIRKAALERGGTEAK